MQSIISTCSGHAQHMLSRGSAWAQHELSTGSAQDQHGLSTNSAQAQYMLSTASAQAQYRLSTVSALSHHSVCLLTIHLFNPLTKFKTALPRKPFQSCSSLESNKSFRCDIYGKCYPQKNISFFYNLTSLSDAIFVENISLCMHTLSIFYKQCFINKGITDQSKF